MEALLETLLSDTTLSLIFGLALLVLVLIILVIRLQFKLRRFLSGKDGKSLEGDIVSVQKDLQATAKEQSEIRDYLRKVEKRLRRSVQGVGTVRFNPFKGTGSGGNQSFATAFLSEEGDGVVISSLYSRERVSIFSKPIKKSASEYELSKEEREAISQAKDMSR